MKNVKINYKALTVSSVWSILLKYKEIICIVILATLLRTWDLNTHMIFFGDAARDLTVAATSVQTRQLPLLGIPSSVPRFHQGPLTIWIEMAVYSLFGRQLLMFGVCFALISVLAVIFLFELLTVYADKKTAIVSALLLSVFPLAVANGRTPYHTTPIPFFLVMYLFGVMQLWRRRKYGIFWSVFTFCLLFQFELATFPLALLIVYTLWKRGVFKRENIKNLTLRHQKRHIFQAIIAVFIGVLPQIIYDLTHRFQHLGGFAIWMMYRVVAFFGYKNQHTFSISQVQGVMSSFQMYLMRTWAGENQVLFFIVLVVFLSSLGYLFWQFKQKKAVPFVVELAVIATGIQSLAYLIHGSPSEAYFPPFFILTAIILGYAIAQCLEVKKQALSVAIMFALGTYALLNICQIWQHHFFVDTSYSFNYGYGVAEQRQIVAVVARQTKGKVVLQTFQPAGKFPTHFDNLRWLLHEKGISEDSSTGQVVFVEPTVNDFPQSVNYMMVPFSSVKVYFVDKGL